MPKYQDPNFDKKAYAWGKRTRPFKARGIVQLDKFGHPMRFLPEYGPGNHKPVTKKAFKKNTRRARRYNMEALLNGSN